MNPLQPPLLWPVSWPSHGADRRSPTTRGIPRRPAVGPGGSVRRPATTRGGAGL